MNEVWRARVALSRVGARVVESGPGGENLAASTWRRWKRCRTRARHKGGSTRWPAWSRSRSAHSPLPGTTGSPRSGSGSGGRVGQTWPGCAPPWDPLARVDLLGVAEHGGRLLDHPEVDVKHNETSHFTALLEPLDLMAPW
jgi:hypothetical protein